MPAGALLGIEIGNEPDLYARNGHRSPAYDFSAFAQDFSAYAAAIQPLLPSGVKFVGPAWSDVRSLKDLPAFLDQNASRLAFVAHHWYAGTQCNGRTNPPDYLLQPSSSANEAHTIAPSVTIAHQRGLPFRMAEINSLSCGGEAGVSDIFASALWIADSLFEFANVGVDGVNIHTGNGGAYALFSFTIQDGAYSVQSIRPEYYGVLLFQQAAPANARVLPESVNTAANVKMWATVDLTGTVRVLLLNKDESASGPIAVQLSSDVPGSLVRLEAPSFDAQSGITLGGMTFDGSQDGAPVGMPAGETVQPAGKVYMIGMPATSAALLTVPPAVGSAALN